MYYRPHRKRQRGKVVEILEVNDSSESETAHELDVLKQHHRELPLPETPNASSLPQKLSINRVTCDPEPNTIEPSLTLIDLPVEIWFEVFEYVDLLDLLRLARTCKVIRGCLMRPSVASIWKRARKNVLDDLPECPSDMNEQAWASLALDNFCHFCGARAMQKILWELRRRSCKNCFQDTEIFSRPPREEEWNFLCISEEVITSSTCYDYRLVCLSDEIADFRKIFQGFGKDEAALSRFVQEQTKKVQEIREHANACRDWEYRYNRRKRAQMVKEYDARVKRRRRAIQQKLKEAGYKDDLKNFKKRFPGRFENHLCVVEGGELTEKEWNRIKPVLVEVLKEEEKRRLQREHNEAIAQLATRPEFEGKRVSRSMFKALSK